MNDSNPGSPDESKLPASPSSSTRGGSASAARALPRLVDALLRLDDLWTAQHRLLRAVIVPAALLVGAALALGIEYIARHG